MSSVRGIGAAYAFAAAVVKGRTSENVASRAVSKETTRFAFVLGFAARSASAACTLPASIAPEPPGAAAAACAGATAAAAAAAGGAFFCERAISDAAPEGDSAFA